MRRIGFSAMSALAVAAVAASLIGPVGSPGSPYDTRRPAKRKRIRLQADRSKKQYLLKGIRP
jgi:hypothetical protein